jgi:hypothetical protein
MAMALPTNDTLLLESGGLDLGLPVQRLQELILASFYPGIRLDPAPNIYAVGRTALGPGFTGFVLRVPGMYSPSRLDLWVLDESGRHFLSPLEVAERWGDAGDSFQLKSWLVDVNRDHHADMVSRLCHTYQEAGVDTAPIHKVADILQVRIWSETGFGVAVPITERALRAAFGTPCGGASA